MLRTNLWKHLLSATSAVEERLGHWSSKDPLARQRDKQMELGEDAGLKIAVVWTSLVDP